MAYDLKKEIEEMEYMTVDQKNRLKQAECILISLNKELTFKHHGYNNVNTALDVLKITEFSPNV